MKSKYFYETLCNGTEIQRYLIRNESVCLVLYIFLIIVKTCENNYDLIQG